MRTSDNFPIHFQDGAQGPAPTDHFTTTTMNGGTWWGCFDSRAHFPNTTGGHEFSMETDNGSISILAGAIVNIRGATFVTPQLAAQTTSSITLRIVLNARAATTDPPIIVKMVAAMAVWNANNTLGTVYTNAKKTAALDTTYALNASVIVAQAIAGGITVANGDRIAVDAWFEVENTAGSNINLSLGNLRWGMWDDPSVGMRTRILTSTPIQLQSGIMVPGFAWGGN